MSMVKLKLYFVGGEYKPGKHWPNEML